MSAKATKSKHSKKDSKKEGEEKKEKYLGGRKLKRSVRELNRKDKLAKASDKRKKQATQPKQEMLLWFQQRIQAQPDKTEFSYPEVVQMIVDWHQRLKDELKELRSAADSTRRPTRAPVRSAASMKLEMLLERRIAENKISLSKGAVAAPELTSPAVVQALREWDGDIKFMQNIKFGNFSQSHESVTTPSQ